MRSSIVAAAALLFVASPTPAETAREELSRLAKKLAVVIKGKGGAIAPDEFKDITTGRSNSGPGLLKELESLLVKEEVKIIKDADLVLEGKYTAVEADGLLRLSLIVNILQRNAKKLVSLDLDYEGLIAQNAEIAVLLGLTLHLPAGESAKERNKRLQPFFDKDKPKPKPEVQDTIVRTQKGSPFGVEIRSKPKDAGGESKGKAVRLENGHQPFVDIDVGDVYEIAIFNNSGKEAAVRITIDGLDVFTFSEDRRKEDGSPQFGTFIIGHGDSPTLIRGWHRTNKSDEELKKEGKEPGNIWKFLVTEYGKGSNSARKVSGKVGVITVTFSGSYLSEDERKKEEGSGRGDPRKETDQGPLDREKFVAVKRVLGVERDVISIRYSR